MGTEYSEADLPKQLAKECRGQAKHADRDAEAEATTQKIFILYQYEFKYKIIILKVNKYMIKT